jgi:Lecithin retinol acyltransferase
MNRELQLVKHFNLEPGDRIIIPKSLLGLVQHHALYLGYNNLGEHLICENVFGVGVKLTRVEYFFQDVKSVTRLEKFQGNNFERRQIVQKALTKLGKPYSLINYNCESFCNEIQHNVIKSPQVSTGLLIVFVGLVFALSNSSYGKQNV